MKDKREEYESKKLIITIRIEFSNDAETNQNDVKPMLLISVMKLLEVQK